MTISFSGLASGLDTSSWIKSLTALKQAKVETLQQQRESVVLSRDTLSSIKSFFATFRSTLERITDTRFNIASMNLFAQNLATSARLNVLTATATQEAEEGKYEVKVDKVATNTQAVSKYQYHTTIEEKTTAVHDSLLKNIGVSAGKIKVNTDAGEKYVNITESDTLRSFIAKLDSIGVEASYNERTGVFSANISASDIDDSIDHTGIVDALHLSSVNKGYTSNQLTFTKVEPTYVAADENTKLSDLGVKTDATLYDTQITVEVNGEERYFTLENGDTIGDLIEAFSSVGIESMIEDGIFTVKNARITSDGETGLLDALGLSGSIKETKQQSEVLGGGVITVKTAVTEDTLLKDITGLEGITDSDTIVVKDKDGNETTITLNDEMELGDLLQAIRDAGLSAELSNNGVITIGDGSIIGGTVDIANAFGLVANETGTSSTTITGSNQLLVSVAGAETNATLDTNLSELGITNADVLTIEFSNGEIFNYSSSDPENFSLSSLMGIIETQAESKGDNFEYSMNDGVLTMTSSTGLKLSGTMAEKLGITTDENITEGVEGESTTAGVSMSSSALVTYTTNVTAGTETTLGELNITEYHLNVYNSDGTPNPYTTVLTSNTKLGAIINYLGNAGITATLSNGVINITSSSEGCYIKGGLAEALGIGATEYAGETVTTGTLLTSSTPVTYEKEEAVNGDSKLGDIFNTMTASQIKALTVIDNNGDGTSTSKTLQQLAQSNYSKNAQDLTIDELNSIFTSLGSTATLDGDGRIVLSSVSNNYITGTLADALGIGASSVVASTTVAVDQTSTAEVTYTKSVLVTGSTMIDEVYTGNSIITVHTSGSVSGLTDTTGMTALSAVTASDMVSGRTYKISTTADLQKLATIVNGGKNCSGVTFVMSNDIDLSSIENWLAIGYSVTNSFRGTFDGNGYEISGLSIDESTYYQGLFGYTDGATIKNLGLTDVDITSTSAYVGALVGYAKNSTIQNVYTEGSVSGNTSVGGLVGYAVGSTLTSCQASGTVVGASTGVGGLVGYMEGGTIASSSSSANVSGKGNVGGIAGTAYTATLISVYSTGTIDDVENSSVYATGGLVGYGGYGLTIRDSWTKASVESGGGSVVGSLGNGTALISNTKALSNNYYASINTSATGTTENCSTITADETPFSITAKVNTTSAITIDVSGMTIDQMFSALQDYTTGSITDGVISFNSTDGNYVTGDLMTAWGISTQTAGSGETIFNSQTSSSVITYNTTANITGTTQIGKTYNLSDNKIVVKSEDGQTNIGTVTITSTMTFNTLFNKLGSLGVEGTISNGVITFESDNNYYVTGGAITAWGIDINTTTLTTSNAVDQTSSVKITYTETQAISGTTEISDFYTGTDSIIVVKTSAGEVADDIKIQGMTDTTGMTALSAVTASNMVLGRTYKISTTADLEQLATIVNGGTNCRGVTFVMSSDIDLSSIENWTAIGNITTGFRGTFDGNGYEISGLRIDATSDYQGLFGYTNGATIKNLGLTGVDITSTSTYVGALVGWAYNSTIQNVYTDGSVSGDYYVGGLVGYASGFTLTSCQVSGTVVGSSSFVGGLVAYISEGTIISSSSSANVSAVGSVGGIVGDASDLTLISVYSTGTIDDTDNSRVYNTGGLVGRSQKYLTIRDSWTKATVESGGGSVVGSLVNCTALISNTKALSNNYYASINTSATGTTENCSTITADETPFTITPYQTTSASINISGMTVNEMFSALSSYTITGSVSADGVISFTSSAGNVVTGAPVEAWGITTTSVVTSATYAIDQTSTAKVTYTQTFVVDETTEINEFYTGTDSIIVVKTSAGEVVDDIKMQGMTDTTNLTALSAVTASDMVSGRTYKISTTADLQKLSSIVSEGTKCTGVTFVMSNDIDLSGITNWTPIGFSNINYFQGIFDGNGYEISGLTINSSSSYQGLFGYLYTGATIKDLGLVGVDITSTSTYTGALAGYAYRATIHNVYTEGTINGASYTGGLIGDVSNTSIFSCVASGTITSTSSDVGGLVGYLSSGTIYSSASYADVTGFHNVGGIVGYVSGTENVLNKVCAMGNITSTNSSMLQRTAGIVGYAYGNLTIDNVYFKGNVPNTGAELVGAIDRSKTVTISNTSALTDNWCASVGSSATLTTNNCTVITADETPFTITPYQTTSGSINISGMTVGEMFNALSTYGITGAVSSEGEITFSSADGHIVTGEAVEAWGITTTSVVTSATCAVDQTSTAVIMYTTATAVTGTDSISDFYTGTDSIIVIKTKSGEVVDDYKLKGMVDTTNLTALSAVTASDMVSGRTYKISTTADLEALATIVNGGTTCSGVTFVMSNDIDLSSIENWTAIGNSTTNFRGTFDGNGYEISGLTINATSNYQGLFGETYNATIKNLGLTDVDIITATSTCVGALIGYATGSTIQNVYTEGSVSGSYDVGGLVGYADGSTLISCQASGTVVGTVATVGGLVGHLYSGTITSSSSSANVSGISYVGGIVGEAHTATLISVYSTGTIDDADNSGVSTTGGLVGFGGSLTIRDSWAKATVESGGGSVVGGLFSGTALVENTKALGNTWCATVGSSATLTTNNCTVITQGEKPFTITPYQTTTGEINLAGMTVDEMIRALESYSITASLSEDGVLTLDSSTGNVITGEAATAWGMTNSFTAVGTIYNVSYTSSTMSPTTILTGSTRTAEVKTIDQVNATINISTGSIIGGNTTDGTIVAISTEAELLAIANKGIIYSGVHFILANDIGDVDKSYMIKGINLGQNSVFDGHGHTIKGQFTVKADVMGYNGFFDNVSSATVQNLCFTGRLVNQVIVSGGVFGFVGSANASATFANISFKDAIIDNNTARSSIVGGLLGVGQGVYIDNISMEGVQIINNNAAGNYTGGLVGSLTGGYIDNITYQHMSIISEQTSGYVAGVVANASGVTITNVATLTDSFVTHGGQKSAITGAFTEAVSVNNVIWMDLSGSVTSSFATGNEPNYQNVVNGWGTSAHRAFLARAGGSNSSWYLNTNEELSLAAPGSNIVSFYDSATGDLVSESVLTTGTTAELISAMESVCTKTVNADGSIQFIADNGVYAKSGALEQLGITTTQNNQILYESTSTSNNLSVIADHTLTENTTWAELGATGDNIEISLHAINGLPEQDSIETTLTFAQTAEYLEENYGILLKLEDGIVTIDYDNTSNYAEVIAGEGYSRELLDLLNIDNEPVHSEVVYTTTYSNTTNETVYNSFEVNKTLNENTTWAELGLHEEEKSFEVLNLNTNEISTFTICATQTVSQTAEFLEDTYGIKLTIQDGKATLDYNNTAIGDRYIISPDYRSSIFAGYLGIELDYENLGHQTVVHSTTYSNTTNETVYNSFDVDKTLTVATTWEDFGFEGDIELKLKNLDTGNYETVTISNTTTMSKTALLLSDYDIGLSISGGKATIDYRGNYIIDSSNTTVLQKLGLNNNHNNAITTTLHSNSTSDNIKETITNTIVGTTTLDKIGFDTGDSSTWTILNKTTGETVTIQPQKTWKIDDLATALDAYDINLTVSNGKVTIESTGDYSVSGISGWGSTELGLPAGESAWITINDTSVTYNTDSNTIQEEKTFTLDENTTWADLGFEMLESIHIRELSSGNDTGWWCNSTIKISETLDGDFYGISSQIVDGKLKIQYGGDYVFRFTEEQANRLNLEYVEHYTVNTTTTWSNSTSDSLTATVEKTMTAESTFGDIGLTTDQELEIVSNGVTKTISVSASTTLEQFTTALRNEGFTCDINGGKITIQGKDGVYVKQVNSTLFDLLNITDTTLYTEDVKTGYSNDSSDTLYVDKTTSITTSTTFSQLAVTTDGNEIEINKNGVVSTITINSTDTVGDLVTKINNIMGSGTAYVQNGKFYINESSNSYISSIDSDIANALKLSTNINDYRTVTVGAGTEGTTTTTMTTEALKVQGEGSTGLAGLDTKLGELIDSEGNPLSDYVLDLGDAGCFTFNADNTIQDVIDTLQDNGITATLNPNGTMSFEGAGSMSISGGLGTFVAGSSPTISEDSGDLNTIYQSSTLKTDTTVSGGTVSDNTLLSELVFENGEKITEGVYQIIKNGVTINVNTTSEDTIGDLRETLAQYGIQTGLVETENGIILMAASNNAYLQTFAGANASNIVDLLFPNGVQKNYDYSSDLDELKDITITLIADETTLVSKFDQVDSLSAGVLSLTVNGEAKSITITSDETFGTLIDKFESIGVSATLLNGEFKINGLDKEVIIDAAASTSALATNLGLIHTDNMSGIVVSTDNVEQTIKHEEFVNDSVAKYADGSTELDMLNISMGSFTIYKNGQKATVNIESGETFDSLKGKLQSKFSDVELEFENGYLKIYSTENATITCGSSVDTSNILSVLGLSSEGSDVKSSRKIYKVNGESKLLAENLFKRGNVTEGTFSIGDATFIIDENTTLNDLIKQINSSAEANVTAYWEPISGKFTIKSRVTGASLVNIEAGTSNFTDIMGFTTSEWAGDGSVSSTKLNIDAQELGSNAEFSIDGTKFTSTSNIVGSDITRIKGLTLNLKEASNETVTVTVEKDYNTIADAMEDVVNAYNELIENVDKEVAQDGNLKDQSTLKFIRNQIRNLMMSSNVGVSTFKNLSSIGISTEAASASNISTANINKLNYNKEKFIEAFRSDSEAVKNLLVGLDSQSGILSKVESVVESAVATASGYFSSAENSYAKQISRLDDKIEKANLAVANYKARLEQKFQYMDMMISKMQEQFSTFLGT